jgi:hypothetical protein
MNRRHLRAGPLAGLCLALILLCGSCDNPANEDDTDTAAAAAKAARDAADGFYAAHRGVFDIWADTLTLADADTVNAALEAYTGLREEVKTLLPEEKARLESLKLQLDAMLAGAEQGAYYTITDLLGHLMEQPENSAEDPCAVAYYGDDNIIDLYKVLTVAGKYIDLDLAKSGVYGFATGTEAGRELIVSLVLPDTLTETPNGGNYTVIFSGYSNLKTVSAAGLVTLGDYAFRLSTTLATVDLPKATNIGKNTFDQCISLAAVNLPEAVSIGNAAFSMCANLATVNLPKATYIDNTAFRGCYGLATISLPNAVTIGSNAFASCNALIALTLPKATTIDTGAFSKCIKLSYIDLPEASTLSANIFRDCASLTEVHLPKAKTMGMMAFDRCIGLTTLTLPEMISFEQNAFRDCASLVTVNLPKVKAIGNQAFTGCVSLATLTLGLEPPDVGTIITPLFEVAIFSGAATSAKNISIKVPGDKLPVYQGAGIAEGKTWAEATNKTNSAAGYFWDSNPETRDNLTVALEAL